LNSISIFIDSYVNLLSHHHVNYSWLASWF
jgi:hypothetical protein